MQVEALDALEIADPAGSGRLSLTVAISYTVRDIGKILGHSPDQFRSRFAQAPEGHMRIG